MDKALRNALVKANLLRRSVKRGGSKGYSKTAAVRADRRAGKALVRAGGE